MNGGMYCWRLYDVLKTWKKTEKVFLTRDLKRHETQKENYTLRGNAIGDKKIEINKMDKELKQKEIQISNSLNLV
jgi:uncharacterized membrane protein